MKMHTLDLASTFFFIFVQTDWIIHYNTLNLIEERTKIVRPVEIPKTHMVRKGRIYWSGVGVGL
jgi:hypothetical protein